MALNRLMTYQTESCGADNQSNREAWLQKTLREIPAGSRLLDAGAGEQQYKKFCAHLQYVSQDFSQYDGQGNGKGLQTKSWDQSRLDIVSDITAIPEPDASFDAIMCIEVFEHIPEPIKAIQEFSRLLKTGGHLILTAPFCSLTHLAPYHFYGGFNRYFFSKFLPENGFLIRELEANGNYFDFLAQEIRRIPRMSNNYTRAQKPNHLESLALKVCLRMLARFSRHNQNSGEVLVYGFHLLAEKRT